MFNQYIAFKLKKTSIFLIFIHINKSLRINNRISLILHPVIVF